MNHHGLVGMNERDAKATAAELKRMKQLNRDLLAAAKTIVCDRLGTIEEAKKWAEKYRDGHAGLPDKGLLALVDAITNNE